MTAKRPPLAGDDGDLATARVRFLHDELIEPCRVRDTIVASWWRSRQCNVAADRVELEYVRDPDLDTPLVRSAGPVLRRLSDQLDGQPLSIVLTDPAGVVLNRWTVDRALERHLDRVQLAPGFSYGECVVGTNGIGTALENGGVTHVFGHEHYAEDLEDLACAAVPIRHPVTGKTVGAVDLTCWQKDAGALLITLAKSTAEQVRQALLTEAGMRELDLLGGYLRACRRTTGMVFALNNDVVMMNDLARMTLTPGDQAALIRHCADAFSGRVGSTTLELPSGTTVRVHPRLVRADDRSAGGIVDARIVEGPSHEEAPAAAGAMLLPGLIGSGTLWRRACAEASTAYRGDEWLVVEGESGVGKLAVVRAVHQRLEPHLRFTVLDGAQAREQAWLSEARRTLAEHEGTVVLRHLDQLDPAGLRSLAAAVQEAAYRPTVRLVAAVVPGHGRSDLDTLVRLFPTTVRIPPLRHHIEDVVQLVPFFLRRLGYGGQLTCSAEVMQLLSRARWPGNVEQLLQVLRRVTKNRRTGVIQAHELPPEIHAVTRRRLTTLESLERDAIVAGLHAAGGNKSEAAKALGMSRATIYRKIQGYGIVST